MAPHLANDSRGAAPPTPQTTAYVAELDRRLSRATRIAAALLRVAAVRAYLHRGSRLELRGSFPAGADAPGDDPQARAAAGDAIRLCAASTRAWRATRQTDDPVLRGDAPPRLHLAIPLLAGGRAPAGALVLSDPERRAWEPEEVEQLRELAALACDGMMPGGEAARGARAPTPPRVQMAGGPQGRLGAVAHPTPPLFGPGGEAALVGNIRQSIVGSLHLGALRAGDRLPSIRQTARSFSVTPYMVLQAYAELEMEGLVERRERSGVFVANFEVSASVSLPETGAWMTEVLTQACQHQVKIPLLPDLIRRWTSAARVRCVCVESCLDSRFALAVELAQQFGIDAIPTTGDPGRQELREADLIITTAYHAAAVGPLAAEVRRPLLIATVSPLILSSALNHLRERDLTVVCVDAAYGERMRSLQGGAYRDRVRVVTVDDAPALAALDRAEAVLLTPAARQRLDQPDFRLVAPMHPSYSLDFARKVVEALVRINLQGSRG